MTSQFSVLHKTISCHNVLSGNIRLMFLEDNRMQMRTVTSLTRRVAGRDRPHPSELSSPIYRPFSHAHNVMFPPSNKYNYYNCNPGDTGGLPSRWPRVLPDSLSQSCTVRIQPPQTNQPWHTNLSVADIKTQPESFFGISVYTLYVPFTSTDR